MHTGLLIDLDGVLYQNGKLIPGAVETVQWIQKNKIAHLFVTNTTSRPRRMIVEKLSGLGMNIPLERILTPPVAACQWLMDQETHTISLFALESTREDFVQFNTGDSQTDAVVIGDLGKDWTFDTLNTAFQILMSHPSSVLMALGLTRYWQTVEGLQLDVGPFVKAIEYAIGREGLSWESLQRHFLQTR